METSHHAIVFILTVGFIFASILGYFTQYFKLSPILGYLLAGYLIGPYSPGFVADKEISEQLAEIGVILMMFGVGLHFKWENLMKVKKIAIPGAICQILLTTAIVTAIICALGGTIEAGLIFGLAIGVTSTVVLIRVLSENKLLNSNEGHIAVGWLIVEDVITVAALILFPTLTESMASHTSLSLYTIAESIITVLFKLILLAAIMFTFGRTVVKYVLSKVLETRSHELFTLAVLALTFAIAVGSCLLFETSMALGAFLGGMVMEQTNMRKQVSHNALPLQDAFVVIFFLSVGMLFNPFILMENYGLLLVVLAIILIIKPITAFILVSVLRYPIKTALIVAISLAQIGEFSFILGEEAMKFNILSEKECDIIVAGALISIFINSLLFKQVFRLADRIEKTEEIDSEIQPNSNILISS